MWPVIIAVLVTLVLVLVVTNWRQSDHEIDQKVAHLYELADPQYERVMGVLMGPAIVPGNRVTALCNGDEIFPSMLEAIGGAQCTITFGTYIYWSGDIGRRFADALVERARAGVKVHVVLDWLGSTKMDASLLDELTRGGVEVERFHPLRWYNLGRMNNRTHRKLLVVDGRVGFTGGVGIADQWMGHAQDPDHWRDIHFRVDGPVVAQFQSAFMDNWIKTSGALLHGEKYFPRLAPTGTQRAHVFVASPAGGKTSMHLMYLLSIAAATHSMDLEASYFLPDPLMIKALVAARARGVRVRILVPDKHLDSETVRVASKREWGPLLQHGVEIYEYEPTMLHCKMLILDRHMVSVGS